MILVIREQKESEAQLAAPTSYTNMGEKSLNLKSQTLISIKEVSEGVFSALFRLMEALMTSVIAQTQNCCFKQETTDKNREILSSHDSNSRLLAALKNPL